MEIGQLVEVTWNPFSYGVPRDTELGTLVALPTKESWAEIQFADGVTWQLPRYNFRPVKVVN